MQTFFKVQATSLIASVTDFLTTIIFVHLLNSWFMAANLIGSVCGGLMNFVVAKKWTFPLTNQPLGAQFGRFFLVWLGNAGINATGLFAVTHLLGIHYLLAKTTVSVLVGVSYNYFFQKDFVFSVS